MTETRIHPTAQIASGAQLDLGVSIEAFAVIGGGVRIAAGTRVGPHAVILGKTTIGRDNQIFHHASVGAAPQDLKYHGEDSELILGDGNLIREFATLHLGTEGGGMCTRLGHRNLVMAYSHVAHDCRLGDHCILSNGTQLGGHVTLGDHVRVGALSGVHQFVRIGDAVMVGAGSMVSQDVPPYCNATGDRANLFGLNVEGLKRLGWDADLLSDMKKAYRLMFRAKLTVAAAVAKIRADVAPSPQIDHFVAFVEASERGVCREKRSPRATPDAG